MSGHPLWTFAHALRTAFASRDVSALSSRLHDEIDWAIFGPIDMFPYLGARQGNEAALDSMAQIIRKFGLHKVKQEEVVLGDGTASALLRCSLNASDTSRPISVRVGAFLRFKDGKLASLRAVIDTFDLVEQTLGRPIHLPAAV